MLSMENVKQQMEEEAAPNQLWEYYITPFKNGDAEREIKAAQQFCGVILRKTEDMLAEAGFRSPEIDHMWGHNEENAIICFTQLQSIRATYGVNEKKVTITPHSLLDDIKLAFIVEAMRAFNNSELVKRLGFDGLCLMSERGVAAINDGRMLGYQMESMLCEKNDKIVIGLDTNEGEVIPISGNLKNSDYTLQFGMVSELFRVRLLNMTTALALAAKHHSCFGTEALTKTDKLGDEARSIRQKLSKALESGTLTTQDFGQCILESGYEIPDMPEENSVITFEEFVEITGKIEPKDSKPLRKIMNVCGIAKDGREIS